MKNTVETQTKCETDDKSDIEFVRITPWHPRECLKWKVAKIIIHNLFIFSDGFSKLL